MEKEGNHFTHEIAGSAFKAGYGHLRALIAVCDHLSDLGTETDYIDLTMDILTEKQPLIL